MSRPRRAQTQDGNPRAAAGGAGRFGAPWRYLRASRRYAAGIATAGLLAAAASDFFARGFWGAHPMLTALIASLLVVLVSVTVIEVILDRRAERRWRLLAQYALLELAENAHMTWTVFAVLLHPARAKEMSADEIQALLSSPERAPKIKAVLEGAAADWTKRGLIRDSLGELLDTGRKLVSGWAVVMTGSRSYAELFDRHVEMLGRIHGLHYFLVHGVRRGREFRVPGGAHADEWFVDNTLSMLSVAALLENETWAMALRVVSPDWWDRRTDELAAPAHAESDSKPAPPGRRLFRKP